MTIAKALDVEAVRFSAPDLSQMHQFLIDFGLLDADDAGDGLLRMRGTGSAPFVHETIEGAAGFAGLTMRVRSLDDLEALAKIEGGAVEAATGPGGGFRVALRDPDGFVVEAIAEKARAPELSHGSRDSWNVIARREREGRAKRLAAGPANVIRLGHVVLNVTNLAESWKWWQSRFGLLVSDEVRTPNGDVAALFIRCDRGSETVDHHTLNFASVPGLPAQFHHAAFEVADLDDLMAGSRHLEIKGYHHDWGVGRHILGSQVFDYWKDPWGHRVEHWTDGDLFDASVAPNITDIPTMMGHQWGPDAPADFAA
ncbi:VOC family protein [Sphingomonas sp. QA11]|uniref:VOC family protein n=1 Tax=Sphingomonas sp. QA11 TaxID=2950605 RepID=UPI00234B2D1B|nr:VOC family protein [Sphingomonas sp. QA11]WCM25013.1 VOC family protein [Sphingomonas sp. QA11]